MRTLKPVALIAAGTATRSRIARLPALAESLGPVCASSFRVASRIVNTIRAGRPVHDPSAFEPCRMILICVPDELVERAIADLKRANLDWSYRSVMLCDSTLDSAMLSPLAALGAHGASINLLEGLLVAEGHRAAANEFRRKFMPDTRMLRLNSGAKQLFLAGLTIAGLPAYVAAAAAECLRSAGIPAGQARKIVQRRAEESVRTYTRGGQQALDARWAESHWAALTEQIESIRTDHPKLAWFYEELLRTSRGLVGKDWPPGRGPSGRGDSG